MTKATVVAQLRYAAVKKREKLLSDLSPAFSLSERVKHGRYEAVYDVWTWNVWKHKWTRMSRDGCDWAEMDRALLCAKEANDEIEIMLDTNRHPPWPIDGVKALVK